MDSLNTTRHRRFGVLGVMVIASLSLQVATGEESTEHQSWPVDSSDYTTWSLQWKLGKAGDTTRLEVDRADDYLQWALQWDLRKVDLVDLRNSIQWLGIPHDERAIGGGQGRSRVPVIARSYCDYFVVECDTA